MGVLGQRRKKRVGLLGFYIVASSDTVGFRLDNGIIEIALSVYVMTRYWHITISCG